MNELEHVKEENQKIASDIVQLLQTEDAKIAVDTAVYIRLNNDMRLQNIQNIKKDISYKAKEYKRPLEKYTTNIDNIIKAYVEEMNRFMKAYNEEFMNIQSALRNAEIKQKEYFLQIRELVVMKNICMLAEKDKDTFSKLDDRIEEFRKKIGIYEKIITQCEEELQECKVRREQDFKELFGAEQEHVLALIPKTNLFSRMIKKFKMIWKGSKYFLKYALQKYESKIQQLKEGLTNEYVEKVKQQKNLFDRKIEAMLEKA